MHHYLHETPADAGEETPATEADLSRSSSVSQESRATRTHTLARWGCLFLPLLSLGSCAVMVLIAPILHLFMMLLIMGVILVGGAFTLFVFYTFVTSPQQAPPAERPTPSSDASDALSAQGDGLGPDNREANDRS